MSIDNIVKNTLMFTSCIHVVTFLVVLLFEIVVIAELGMFTLCVRVCTDHVKTF